jgi:hypothetical protein
VARVEVVSWLRAASLTFPTVRSVVFRGRIQRPLQWRGRTGFTPVSVASARRFDCATECSAVVRPRQRARLVDFEKLRGLAEPKLRRRLREKPEDRNMPRTDNHNNAI